MDRELNWPVSLITEAECPDWVNYSEKDIEEALKTKISSPISTNLDKRKAKQGIKSIILE